VSVKKLQISAPPAIFQPMMQLHSSVDWEKVVLMCQGAKLSDCPE